MPELNDDGLAWRLVDMGGKLKPKSFADESIAIKEGWCALMNAALNVECYFTKDLSRTISEWELETLRGAIDVAWKTARSVGFNPTEKELCASDHEIEVWLQKQDDDNDA